ncbi:MAG: YfiR family protein [Comamonadaceae bacterium]|nr:MAG: YfiR family protein [Comamonadaceae bacterium]
MDAALAVRPAAAHRTRPAAAPRERAARAGRARLHRARRAPRLAGHAGGGDLAARAEPAGPGPPRVRTGRQRQLVRAPRDPQGGRAAVRPTGVIVRGLLALCAGVLLAAAVQATSHSLGLARASAVKAAFLYKFGSFVEWPAGSFRTPGDTLVIGVFGDEALASELEQITQGRRIETHPIAVRRVRDAEEAAGAHILYAGGARESRARELVAAVRGPVLTVADVAGSGRGAPVLYFTEEEGRVRFGASLPAAAARGLKLSAKLLAVAQDVEGR